MMRLLRAVFFYILEPSNKNEFDVDVYYEKL